MVQYNTEDKFTIGRRNLKRKKLEPLRKKIVLDETNELSVDPVRTENKEYK